MLVLGASLSWLLIFRGPLSLIPTDRDDSITEGAANQVVRLFAGVLTFKDIVSSCSTDFV